MVCEASRNAFPWVDPIGVWHEASAGILYVGNEFTGLRVVVIVGGVGSIPGAALGGFCLRFCPELCGLKDIFPVAVRRRLLRKEYQESGSLTACNAWAI